MINFKTLSFSALIFSGLTLWADSDMERLVYIKGEKLSSQDVLQQAEQQLGFRCSLKAPDRMAFVKTYDDLVSFGQIVSALTEYYRVHNGLVLEVQNLGRGRYVFATKETVAVEPKPKLAIPPELSLPSDFKAVDLEALPTENINNNPQEAPVAEVKTPEADISVSEDLKKASRRELVKNELMGEVSKVDQLEILDVEPQKSSRAYKLEPKKDKAPPSVETVVQDPVDLLPVANSMPILPTQEPSSPNPEKQSLLEVEVLGKHIKSPDLDVLDQKSALPSVDDASKLADLDAENFPKASEKSPDFMSRMMNLKSPEWSTMTECLPKFNGVKPLAPLSPALIGFASAPNLFDDESMSGWGLASSFAAQRGSSGPVSADLNVLLTSPYYRWSVKQFTVENRLDGMLIDGDVNNKHSQKWSGSTFTASSLTTSVEKAWAMPLDQTQLKSSFLVKLPIDRSLGVESSGSLDVGLYAGVEKRIDQSSFVFQMGALHCGNHDFYGDTQNVAWDGRLAFEQMWKDKTFSFGLTMAESPLKNQRAEVIDGQILRFELGMRDGSARLPFGVRLYVGASEASADWGLSINWKH